MALFTYCSICYSQAPGKIPYQSIAKDYQGRPIEHRAIFIRCSIIDSALSGPIIYAETHPIMTLEGGLFSVVVGNGISQHGSFDQINWGWKQKFLQIEIDTTAAGSNYYKVSSQQLLSVPYALFSANGIPHGGAEGQVLTLESGSLVWTYRDQVLRSATCGADSVHNPAMEYGFMTDQDGNQYKTIVIGNQEWMAENLKAEHYRNGDVIPEVYGSGWGLLTTGSCLWPMNNAMDYSCPYGKLYNWYAVSDSRNLCPSGWHVPTDGEWNTLVKYLDSYADTFILYNYSSYSAGGKMKASTNQYWINPNFNADNASGFSALPSGYIPDYSAIFANFGSGGYWWTSTESTNSPDQAYWRILSSADAGVLRWLYFKKCGASVRCLKN